MKTIQGDLVRLALDNRFDVIIHGCNCFCTMGAGIAKTIKQKFPEAFEADLKTECGEKSKLDTFSKAEVELNGQRLVIVNAYTQYDWKGKGLKADYNAIRNVFREVKREFSGLRIGYPAIGAGLAGGDWKIIAQIIEEELAGEDHTFVEYKK